MSNKQKPPKQSDREVILTEDLDAATIEAILAAQPGERSRNSALAQADYDRFDRFMNREGGEPPREGDEPPEGHVGTRV